MSPSQRADLADDGERPRLWLQVAFGKREKAHALRVRLPRRPPPGEASSLRLLFDEGAAEVSGHVRGLKPTITTARHTGEDGLGTEGRAPIGTAAGGASGHLPRLASCLAFSFPRAPLRRVLRCLD